MKILFITHDSSLTGAPIVFLHLLSELKMKHDIEGDILTLKNGPLDDRFRMVFRLIAEKKEITFIRNLKRILKVFRLYQPIKSNLSGYDLGSSYDLIYCNTAATARLVPELKEKFKCSMILHVHELQLSIEQFAGIEIFKSTLPHVDVFIAASKAVSVNLLELGIPENKVQIVHESIPVTEIKLQPLNDETLNSWKQNNYFIVGGAGTTDWRKGTDLFLYTAFKLSKTDPNIRFIWVGGFTESIEYKRIQYELKKLGLENLIHFTGMVTNPNDYYNLFDLFFLTSREDPFPLVCLENALLGKPVICFEGAGGIPELVEKYNECIIPFASVEESHNRILMFKENNEKRGLIGNGLQSRVISEFNIARMAEKIMNIFKVR